MAHPEEQQESISLQRQGGSDRHGRRVQNTESKSNLIRISSQVHVAYSPGQIIH